MLAKISETQAGKGFEFDIFSNLVTSGKLYEFFIEKFKNARANSLFRDAFAGTSLLRDAVKKHFLTYLFYDPSDEGQIKDIGVVLIRKIFPKISELFLQLKQPNYCQFSFHALSSQESYKFPPQLLQRIESHLVIEVVCKGLKRDNKLMPLFTIHDSIVTTKEYEQIVHDKMNLELTKAIGYEPKIQPEYFTPSSDFIDINYFTVKDKTAFSDELLDRLSEW